MKTPILSPFVSFRSKFGWLLSWLLKPVLLVFAILLLHTHKAAAQQSADYAIQANIIYRFTKYIDWPENKKSGDFIIGIVGDSPLTDELKSFIANKTVSNRKIVIKTFSSSGEVYPCHILFISEDESGSVKKIAARTSGSSLLLV